MGRVFLTQCSFHTGITCIPTGITCVFSRSAEFEHVGKKAVVTFPYSAQHSSELNLSEGEVSTKTLWLCSVFGSPSHASFPPLMLPPSPSLSPPPSSCYLSFLPSLLPFPIPPLQNVEIIAEEEEGWWKGKVGHKEGVFPSNFVQVLNSQVQNHGSDTTDQGM